MSKARDLANASTALNAVTPTELGYLDGVTSAVQTQLNAKEATLPSQTGNTGKYLTTDGSSKSWGTVSQYSLPSQSGNSGKYLTTNGTAESWGTVSQPITFTLRQKINSSGNGINDIVYNGSNLYIAVGQGGTLYSSPDGTTWTSRTSGFGSNEINSVAYGAGIFVAVGANGTITTSTDGTTWTSRTSGVSTNQLRKVRFLNNLFIAVGVGANGGTGGITTSSDGITWTKRTTPTTSSTTLTDVNYGNGYYVALGGMNTRAGYYSTDGASWTVLPASVPESYAVFYANSTWWAYSYDPSGSIYYASTPSGTWASPFGMNTGIYVSTTPRYSIYNNSLYFLPGSQPTYLFKQPLTATDNNAGFDAGIDIIQLPGAQYNTTYNSTSSRIGCVYVNSSGGIVLGDVYGRIYTSF